MNSRKRLAVVTAPRAFEVFYEDRYLDPIKDALVSQNIDARVVAWYDDEDWASFDGAVLRSPWDIYWNGAEFLDWLDRAAALMPLANPAATVKWAFDKRYLPKLAATGVPTVPTSIFDNNAQLPDHDFVIKPALSGGGLNTAIYTKDQHDAARDHAHQLTSKGTVPLVQSYLSEVDTHGERGLIFLGGRFSHAISKSALLRRNASNNAVGARNDVDNFHPNLAPHKPASDELDIAHKALSILPAEPVFARVDMISVSGQPTVLELELIDPDLFFQFDSGAFNRYINALAEWASRLDPS